MLVNEENFKKCLGSFVTGVTIITTIDKNQKPQGVTISSFSSLSLKPPMVAFNLGRDSNSYPVFIGAEYFTVNILSEGQKEISDKFAWQKDEKWQGLDYSTGKNGCPVIGGASVVIECKKAEIYRGGDHDIITGKVINLENTAGKEPLLHYRGNYFSLGKPLGGE